MPATLTLINRTLPAGPGREKTCHWIRAQRPGVLMRQQTRPDTPRSEQRRPGMTGHLGAPGGAGATGAAHRTALLPAPAPAPAPAASSGLWNGACTA